MPQHPVENGGKRLTEHRCFGQIAADQRRCNESKEETAMLSGNDAPAGMMSGKHRKAYAARNDIRYDRSCAYAPAKCDGTKEQYKRLKRNGHIAFDGYDDRSKRNLQPKDNQPFDGGINPRCAVKAKNGLEHACLAIFEEKGLGLCRNEQVVFAIHIRHAVEGIDVDAFNGIDARRYAQCIGRLDPFPIG